MSNLVIHAERELDLIGMTEDGDMNGMMRKHILHMVKEFSEEGHSGFSANYAIQCLSKLLAYKPLSPLTGEDDEWSDVAEENGESLFQNKRYSSVFKVGKEGEAYNIDGKVFWNWFTDENGEQYKSYYTSSGSKMPVTFPYTVPDEPIYEYVPPEKND